MDKKHQCVHINSLALQKSQVRQKGKKKEKCPEASHASLYQPRIQQKHTKGTRGVALCIKYWHAWLSPIIEARQQRFAGGQSGAAVQEAVRSVHHADPARNCRRCGLPLSSFFRVPPTWKAPRHLGPAPCPFPYPLICLVSNPPALLSPTAVKPAQVLKCLSTHSTVTCKISCATGNCICSSIRGEGKNDEGPETHGLPSQGKEKKGKNKNSKKKSRKKKEKKREVKRRE